MGFSDGLIVGDSVVGFDVGILVIGAIVGAGVGSRVGFGVCLSVGLLVDGLST